VLPPGIAAPTFSLRDQDQKQASLSDYRGQVVVVTFLYSHCQDTCPVTAQQIRGAFDQMGHDVPALAVSVDPANDTPDSARQFLTKQHVLGRIRFLLGSPAQLAPIWKGYFVDPEGGRFEHTAFVYLVDRRGQLRVGFPASQLTPEALAHDINLLSAQPG
jgi:protein SCO1/2